MRENEDKLAISKRLTRNDVGANGSHQAGICIPKDEDILSFFPELGKSEKNPYVELVFLDNSGQEWNFKFIYYNGKFFNGTRNEYRLTKMTKYMRSNHLEVGDSVILKKDKNNSYSIGHKREKTQHMRQDGVISIGNQWTVIKIKE